MHDEPFLFSHEFNKQIGIILSNPDNQWWIRSLGLLMGILAIHAILRGVGSLYANYRIRHRFKELNPQKYPRFYFVYQALVRKMGLNRKITVLDVSNYKLPVFTLGWLKPAILVSPFLIEQMNDEELTAIFAHELAHIIRRDNLSLWFMNLVRYLFPFLPLRIWIVEKFLIHQEQACDDWVVRTTGNSLTLAQAILKVWKYSRSTLSTLLLKDLYLCHELIGKRSAIEARVRRLVNPPKKGDVLRKRVFAFILLFLLLVGFLAIQIVWARHGSHSESPGCQHNMK